MKLVAFFTASVAEMATPANRPRLRTGIMTGFGFALAFGVLAAGAAVAGLTAWRWVFVGLIGGKLVTNGLAWFALSRDRCVMVTQGVNSVADVVLLTAAMYFTGGPYSPLLATYVIVIAVLSLLSNLGVTILMALVSLASFATMTTLLATGVLPPTTALGEPGVAPSVGFTITAIAYCGFVVGVPAWFSAATLRNLHAKEADLEMRTVQLIEAAAQRSQFVASMTHELRTPIHGVQGLSDLIAAGVYGPVTDKQKDACASIKRSAQSLLHLIDDVLHLTRAEASKIDAHPGPVDVTTLVERVTASISWMVGTKSLVIDSEVSPELPTIQSDERWLAHILVNLLANAVKFTPEGGRVTLRARPHDTEVELAVEDTGIGIAPEDRARIFEPFRQGERGDEKGYGGVGLGLALVAKLVDLLGARVELDSTVNKGSTFRVIVPVVWRGRVSAHVSGSTRIPIVR
ncbi:MAG: sensor histidine kinase [Kofleriaceae bacterium]